jgi:hypothetical protein
MVMIDQYILGCLVRKINPFQMMWCTISTFHKFDEMNSFLIFILIINLLEIMMNQLILLHKPNKKVMTEKLSS